MDFFRESCSGWDCYNKVWNSLVFGRVHVVSKRETRNPWTAEESGVAYGIPGRLLPAAPTPTTIFIRQSPGIPAMQMKSLRLDLTSALTICPVSRLTNFHRKRASSLENLTRGAFEIECGSISNQKHPTSHRYPANTTTSFVVDFDNNLILSGNSTKSDLCRYPSGFCLGFLSCFLSISGKAQAGRIGI
jgi:hypothetical protein